MPTATESRVRLRPGFIVNVRGEEGLAPDLAGASEATVVLVRPDQSVVERRARPVGGAQLEVALHGDDLSLAGDYIGEVRCTLGDEQVSFSPAFRLRLGGMSQA